MPKLVRRPRMLIIGSGFHQHISGASSPLSSWCCLLQRLAGHYGVQPSASSEAQPTLFWEEMISSLATAAQSRGKSGGKSSYQIEAAVKKQAADLLRAEENKMRQAYASHALQASLWKSFFEEPGHIVSLNFDRLLITASDHKAKKVKFPTSKNLAKSFPASRKADLTNLFARESIQTPKNRRKPTQVWFPHGKVTNTDTLRL